MHVTINGETRPIANPQSVKALLESLGLDSRKLEIPGRKRLEVDHGAPIREIMA